MRRSYILAFGGAASGRREGGPRCVAGGIIRSSGGISDAAALVSTAFTQRLSMRSLNRGGAHDECEGKVVGSVKVQCD